MFFTGLINFTSFCEPYCSGTETLHLTLCLHLTPFS